MVTGSAALTEGVVKVDQVVYDTGGWNCGGYYARDIAAGGLGNTTFVPALAASSDGYFFRLAWWLGNERLRKYALAFGLDAKTRHRSSRRKRGQLADQRVGDANVRRADGAERVVFLGHRPRRDASDAAADGQRRVGGDQRRNALRPQIVREIRSPERRSHQDVLAAK